jgi:YVTN family beta-propeller protein
MSHRFWTGSFGARVVPAFVAPIAGIALAIAASMPALAEDFANFESAHVHPVALSADRTQLFAVNTPDSRLSVFDVAGDGSLSLDFELVVGLEPVSLAVRGDEVWVVNHLSDSVSVVDVSERRVVATIRTGDEPTDVVFAGARAFVSMAGGRDQVKAYDATTRAEVGQLDVFGDDPRALAASADGSEVYLVVLESGNRTASFVPEQDGGTLPAPSPPRRAGLPPPDADALIVQFNPASGLWEDEYGTPRGDITKLDVPDYDVFVIDAATMQLDHTIQSVGTSLFEVAVQPGSGNLFVANTEARNLVRFEPNLRGHFIDTRLTMVEPAGGGRTHFDLNPHVDFGVSPGPANEIEASVATPGDVEFTSDGSRCYVASFGSAKVAVVDPSDGSVDARIAVGGGPSGLALAEALGRLYVVNRFDNTISIVDTVLGVEVGRMGIAGPGAYDPSPDAVRNGRRLLYDATASSGHGDASCASCHVFGNFDGIAWDLGDPQGSILRYDDADWVEFSGSGAPANGYFHPMKGPMVTQTLRGLADMEPFHWRGDRRNFQHFNGAFVSLMGRDDGLSEEDMDLFADFAMTIRFPPNPNRTLDDQLPATFMVRQTSGYGALTAADPAAGADVYFNGLDDDRLRNCVDCHEMPHGTNNTLQDSVLMTQVGKIAQLRSVYEKVGLGRLQLGAFGNVGAPVQKSGFGVLHDGKHSFSEFLFAYFAGSAPTHEVEQNVAAFVMAFPTETPPIVGHQVTLDHVNARSPDSDASVALLLDQAAAGNCDAVVHGVIAGQSKSFAYDVEADRFVPDSLVEPPLEDTALRSSLVAGDVVTYMGVPAGSGRRLGIDRDRDTWRDADELVEGSDHTDIDSTPVECRGADSGSLEGAKLSLRASKTDENSDLLAARGRIDLTGLEEPALDLVATGFIVAIRDAGGEVITRRWIRPGSLEEKAAKRWKLRKGSEAGVRRAEIRGKDGIYRVKFQATVPGELLASAAFPIEMIAVLGTADQDAADQCGRLTFEDESCEIEADRSSCR